MFIYILYSVNLSTGSRKLRLYYNLVQILFRKQGNIRILFWRPQGVDMT